MNRALIDSYANGTERLKQSVRGLTREDLLAKPAEPEVGKWSIQQVVMHLVDCEGVFVDRMKRVIAEENPSLLAFDENKWAGALGYDERLMADELALFELLRKQMAVVLKTLPDSALARPGTHNKEGRVTLNALIDKAVTHLDHHLKFIHAKREKMGKEMW